MAPALLATFLWVLALGNYRMSRDVVHPGVIQAGLWAVVVTVFSFTTDRFTQVSWVTLATVALGAAAFTIGVVATTFGHRPHLRRTSVHSATMPTTVVFVCFAGAAVGMLPLMLQRAASLAAGGPTDSTFINLRYALTTEGETYGRLMYAVWLSYVTAGLFLLRAVNSKPALSKWVAAGAMFVVGLAYASCLAGRGFVVFLLTFVTGVLVIQRAVAARWVVLAGGAVALLLFGAYGIALNKGGDADATLLENVTTLSDMLVVYLASSIPALDVAIHGVGELAGGSNTFLGAASILKAWGFNVEVKQLVQPFVNVPMPTNVYTIYQPYIADFGFAGPVGMMLLIGAMHGFLYRKASIERPRSGWVLAYALMLFPLTMQYSTEFYMSYLKQWIVFGALMIAACVIFTGSGVLRSRR